MARFVCLFVLLALTNSIYAQLQVIDSLKNEAAKSSSDVELADLYNLIAASYTPLDIDSSAVYNEMAIRKSLKENYLEGLAMAYHQKSNINYAYRRYDSAIYWIDSSLKTWNQLGNKPKELSALVNLAILNNLKGNKEEALAIYKRGLQESLQFGELRNVIIFRVNIGSYFHKMNEFDSAMYQYEKARQDAESSNDKVWLMRIISNIGHVHWKRSEFVSALENYRETSNMAKDIDPYMMDQSLGWIAMVFTKIGDHIAALEYFDQVSNNHLKYKRWQDAGYVIRNMASAYLLLEDYDNAIDKSLRSIELLAPNDLSVSYGILVNSYINKDSLGMASKYVDLMYSEAIKHSNLESKAEAKSKMAEIALIKGSFKRAKELLTEALDIPVYLPIIKLENIHTNLANAYASLGDSEKAFVHIVKASAYKDSLQNEEKTNALTRSAVEFETERKEQALIKVQQESKIKSLELDKREVQIARTNFSIVVGVILLAALGLIVILLNSRKQLKLKTEAVLSQQKSLRLQMNPHFIFNALASIQEYMNEESIDKANNYLIKFGRLMRRTLENSRTEFIPLETEIESIEDYLELQSLHHNMGFDYEVKHDFEESLEDYQIPPMFVQPFVENAIEHGLSTKYGGGVTVTFSSLGEEVKVTINDTGNPEQNNRYAMKEGYKSLSNKIIEERIYNLNRLENTNARLDITSEESGTIVTLFLPIRPH
ncbi:histidine kinase [Roseivirga misakiensis]|uniref:Signal transduction histidine kinase internal region domain-containing protein n=1 Tax=Roseivirga misakiensis TaxID=1563681 RepID=A0A1E5T770_9BACT|nr:histidine kinase [Roseivirga misakiensis]OEK07198.1 hypothetical protein BFP71_05970 [Roseivirga misakiensis]